MAAKRKKQNSTNNTGGAAVKNGGNINNSNRKSKGAAKKKQLQQKFMNENDYRLRLQEVLCNTGYILQKIFRKDGPALGVEFNSLPLNAFRNSKPDSKNSHHACQENQRAIKKQKVSTPALDFQACSEERTPTIKHGIGKGLMTKNGTLVKKHGIGKGLMTKKSAPLKKHGIGKGLMTVWRVNNPDGGDFPTGIGASTYKNLPLQSKQRSLQRRQSLLRKLGKRLQEKRKPSIRCQKETQDVGRDEKIQKQNWPRKEKCELAFEGLRCEENLDRFAALVDDEELELRELQAGPNPLTCSAHFRSNGLNGCSLCKDLLAKFPPDCVSMKLPLYTQPWDSSPELVKKLFKVFHFLCTYALRINMCSFTLADFAIAFQDKFLWHFGLIVAWSSSCGPSQGSFV